MKTTFGYNFDLFQAFKQHGYTKTWKQREAVNLKSFTLITCNTKKACLQLKLKKKVVFFILILLLTTVVK